MYQRLVTWAKLRDGWGRRFFFVFLLLLFCLAFGRYLRDCIDLLRTDQTLVDFEAYLYAAKAITLGENPYVYCQQINVFPYKYPPTLAILLVPLTYLSPLVAQRIWLILNQLLLGGALFLSLKVSDRRLSNEKLLLVGCITFGFYPLYTNLKLGQVGVVLYFLVALMFWLWQKKRVVLAGLCLGLAGAIKVIPLGLVAYFLWKKEYRMVLYSVLFFFVIQLMPDLLLGTDWLLNYIEAFSSFYRVEDFLYFSNQSLYSFFVRFFTAAYYDLPQALVMSKVLTIISGAIVLVTSFVFCRRDQKTQNAEIMALEVGGILVTIILLNPVSWHHYFIWLLFISPVLVSHLSDMIRQGRSFKSLVVAGLAIIAFAFFSQPFRLPRVMGYEISDQSLPAVLMQSLIFYGALLVWGIILSLLYTSRKKKSRVIVQ